MNVLHGCGYLSSQPDMRKNGYLKKEVVFTTKNGENQGWFQFVSWRSGYKIKAFLVCLVRKIKGSMR